MCSKQETLPYLVNKWVGNHLAKLKLTLHVISILVLHYHAIKKKLLEKHSVDKVKKL